tara:strand:- start:392 stop:1603 length:1212 start_codon:yes stop_codon:yes gene_type:complete
MLDMEVSRSFSGWFYGWFFPRLKDRAQRRKIEKIMRPIHDDGDFIELSNVPWLETLFETHDHFETWLYWVRRVYPKNKIIKLDHLLDAASDSDVDKFEMVKPLNLHFTRFEDPRSWPSLPKRSVLLIDECQQYFPPRPAGSKVPPAIAALETHRHGGYDIHFVTQDRTLCDANLRKLVGRHIHFFNPFGGERVTRKESPKVFNPDDYHDSKVASKKIVKRDKNFYGVYWSAEIHTHKPKIPLMAFAGLIALAVFCWSAYNVYHQFLGGSEPQPVQQAKPSSSPTSPEPSAVSLDSQLDKYVAELIKGVYISGSMTHYEGELVSIDYVFYRESDGAAFDPSSIGLSVQPINSCFANFEIGSIVRPITCNPFYVRDVVEERDDIESEAMQTAKNTEKHKPNISLF